MVLKSRSALKVCNKYRRIKKEKKAKCSTCIKKFQIDEKDIKDENKSFLLCLLYLKIAIINNFLYILPEFSMHTQH